MKSLTNKLIIIGDMNLIYIASLLFGLIYNTLWICITVLLIRGLLKKIPNKVHAFILNCIVILTLIWFSGIQIPATILKNQNLKLIDSIVVSNNDEKSHINSQLRDDGSPFYRGIAEITINYIAYNIYENDQCIEINEFTGKKSDYNIRVIGFSYFFLPTRLDEVECKIK